MTRAGSERFARHDRAWRDPAQIVAQWSGAEESPGDLLAARAARAWWDVLEATDTTLIVSREYEHLLLAVNARSRPRLSYLRLPHPSGIAFDRARGMLYVASTRNPNQIYALAPVDAPGRPLLPARSWYLPGGAYVHDLAMIGTRLHANAVGHNVVIAFDDDAADPVWWPASIERAGAPRTDRNYIQLNSIAAGRDLNGSYFTASSERPGRLRPGHVDYPVDGRGVVFSGATREPVLHGLTRPHSARLHRRRLWLDNSGYGEVGVAAGARFEPVGRLPGWTRGLAFAGDVAFVGTSRVIPRFRRYAPGLDLERSVCAIHALDARTGAVLGSLTFPSGNQIFAIEAVPAAWSAGFPFHRGVRPDAVRALFYGYRRA